MSNFFKSKFFIIALLFALALVIVSSVLSFMGVGFFVKDAIGVIASPISAVIDTISDAFDGFTMYFREYDNLKAENRILRDKLAELEGQIYEAELYKEENEWLYNYLELKREHTDYSLLSASVIRREAGNYMTVITLDKGTAHGVEVNMPVITNEGIVGYVSEVGLNFSKVLTIIETATSIGAYIERTGELGLVEGVYELNGSGYCRISYLPTNADIKVGDKIVSSGVGSIYPRGLIIGVVSEIVPDEFSRNLTAVVKPSAALNNISDVMILTGFEPYVEQKDE